MSILIVGSFMMDMVIQTPRAPKNGETIIGLDFSQYPGGKGANQAVAAARLGANVQMAGKVGVDPFGDEAIAVLKKENIDIQYLQRDYSHRTGVGFVTLEENGDNRIIVIPGANMEFSMDDIHAIKEGIAKSKLLVLQLEMDMNMIEEAINIAYNHHVPIILNPAPARYLSDDLLKKIAYLTPNETEAEILTKINISTLEDVKRAAKILMEKGVENVIVTLGEKGALIVNQDGEYYIKGYPVEAIDTVAAGDAFNGAFAYGISQGKSLLDAVAYANIVGALTVTKRGAIPSLPTSIEVENFINNNNTRSTMVSKFL
ncbi:ribokinase [Bacillus sp. IITD106]|nr:ribokinase [Bacillus sp. IITD106]